MMHSIRAGMMLLFAFLAQQFPQDLSNRAMTHVEFLAGLGNRVTGTPNEAKAIEYIRSQMKNAGLQVSVEPFSYHSFEFEKAVLRVGNETATTSMMAFDVYGDIKVQAPAIFLETDVVNDGDRLRDSYREGKIAVTTGKARLFRFGYYKTPAAVIVSPEDFERLRKQPADSAELLVEGHPVEGHSANVVGILGPANAAREVIISAHHDTAFGPGAADNSSGVAAVLELARYFAKREQPLPFRMKFVTFGGEETGLLGSKAYLMKHLEELKKCELLFNVDTIGDGEFFLEMEGGVKGIPAAKAQNQIPADQMDKAIYDLHERWMLMRQDLSGDESSNVPPWLDRLLRTTANELNIQIRPSINMGSDHAVFMQAGIAATNIMARAGKLHTAEDLPGNVGQENFTRAAKLIARVIESVGASKGENK